MLGDGGNRNGSDGAKTAGLNDHVKSPAKLRPARLPAALVLFVLLLLTPFICLFSLSVGALAIGLDDLVELLTQLLFGTVPDTAAMQSAHTVIAQIRIPRVMLAWLIGACLALSGAAMQGLFRNPLADPSIIGVTSGASLGASVAIVIFAGTAMQFAGLSILVLGAFLGGLLAAGLVYRLSTRVHGTSVATMLLVGIAITALAGAANSALAFFADNEMLRRISLWNMGALDVADKQRVQLALLITLPASVLLMHYRSQLDALLLGESEARHLGIDVGRLKRVVVFLVAIAVGSAVALAGVIGFVGLIVPHMLRLLIGPAHAYLLPCSALAGGLLLVLADTLARVLVSPAEMPVGVITATLGAPFFIMLLLRRAL